ncbi:hypothetical protein LO772_09705 [Yinghuangia sp. ASG 101]|uniref:hypothetical protein n=1 Tax=Yinghuangia sp. ASG 101 TaxID=2896848 RepID=UPI001E29FD44|nr:hypothetical protein [Yinghuangia sp. ASG 101]UGQ13837.1 hypothetical protein LO772_09705 [Yinghuangia sp. ASG 101]
MPKITVSLDANLAIDVMLLSGTRSPQDAVELIVRDYLARGHRTEARTGRPDHGTEDRGHIPTPPET